MEGRSIATRYSFGTVALASGEILVEYTGSVQRSRRRRFGVPVAVAALLVTAVGSASSTGTASALPGAGTAFVVGLSTAPPTLNRNLISDAATVNVALAIFDGLVTANPEQQIVPELAESWEVSDDGLVYTFRLVEGIDWHDGEPFTADDVVFTMEEILPLTPAFGNVEGLIGHVEATDDYIVVVTLTRPYAPFLSTLIPPFLTILPEHLYAGTDVLENEYNVAPIGTGAFMFESWEGDTITLVRNEEYFQGTPGYGRLIYEVLPDANLRGNAMLGGEIDYLSSNDTNPTVIGLVRDDDGIFIKRGRASYSMGTLSFNTRNPPLDNPEVRKALYMALDRELIAAATDADGAAPAVSGVASNNWASAPDFVNYDELFPFDPDAAEAMLDAAGYPRGEEGVRFELTHRYFTAAVAGPPSAAIIADQWGSIGVEVDLVADERAVGAEAVYMQHDFDTVVNNVAARLDPQTGFVPQYWCIPDDAGVANQNPTGYCSPEFEELAEQAGAATDQQMRRDLFIEMQQIVADEMPASPLIEVNDADIIRVDVGGIDEFFAGADGGVAWHALTPPAED